MFSRYISLIVILSFLVTVAPASAATPAGGTLVKSPDFSDVYYVGADAKRYVFPNEKTYFNWYTGFDVTTISKEELAAIPLGGAVTYRPGVWMVKVTTDPKTYAVEQGGVLRWIKTEAVAESLYGSDWSAKIHDLPDEFYATYSLGEPIESANAYDPAAARDATTTIGQDKSIEDPEVPPDEEPAPDPSSGSLEFTASDTTVHGGDVVTLYVEASHPTGIREIKIFFDGILSKNCTTSICSDEVTIPLSGTKDAYEAKAIASAIDGTPIEKTLLLTVNGDSSSLAMITLGRSKIRSGDIAEVIIDADVSIAVLRTDIYLDHTSIEACASAIRQCRWSDILTGDIGTVYLVYGIVKDTLGRNYKTQEKTITISDNDSPTVSILAGKEEIYVGETVDVTVNASDDDGIATIEILRDETVLKTCTGAAPCTLVTGPWNETGTLIFRGRAIDSLGLSAETDPVFVTVTDPSL